LILHNFSEIGDFMVDLQTLSFLRKLLEKRRLHTHLLRLDRPSEYLPDLGLRQMLGLQPEHQPFIRDLLKDAKHNTVYRYTDRFFCSYFLLLLPDTPEALIAGPYTTFDVTGTFLLEKAEIMKIPPHFAPRLEQFYAQLPVISEVLPLLNVFTAFGEVLWGSSDAFRVEFIDATQPPIESVPRELPEALPLLDMQLMEERYHFENQLMEMVSRGQLHRVEAFTETLTSKMFESRVADPVRNLKNYCIICNTLLRKAAERGGVHPFYLDQISSDFAQRIETVHDQTVGLQLLPEMVRAYCRLVLKHSGDSYSPQVRKAVLLIESDLTRDLTLRAVAKELALSPSYLSALFKKETGKTFTEFVTQQRMLHGKRLLETTKLQVQTIAQYCGIPDVNYFSKCFKKHFGITPRASRE